MAQEDVLANAALLISHGGFGTTQAALVTAVPQIVIPLFSFDQFANAERVEATGLGVALVDGGAREQRAGDLVPHGPRAVGRLAAAVTTVLRDEATRTACGRLAAEIEALPPATECLVALEATM